MLNTGVDPYVALVYAAMCFVPWNNLRTCAPKAVFSTLDISIASNKQMEGNNTLKAKEILRKEMKVKLLSMSKALYEHRSYIIAQTLYKEALWKSSSTIGITVSNPPEVDTYQIIRKAWEEGKKVVIPKCIPQQKQMFFRQLERFDQLETVYFGLLEPIESETEQVTTEDIDLLIVPGIAFMSNGYRMGAGGGYYDRFLQGYHGNTMSLAFEDQIVSSLPIEAHDIPVAKIITNERSMIVS
jgi:5-formyltetrahydrofolate cyclo-ligase